MENNIVDARDEIIKDLETRLSNLEDRLYYDEQMMDQLFIRLPEILEKEEKEDEEE